MSVESESFFEWFKKDDWIHVIVGFVLAYLWGIILEFTTLWYLMFIAGIIGGIFAKVGWKSFLVGFGGIFCAWLTFFVIFAVTSPLLSLTILLGDLISSMVGLPFSIPPFVFPLLALIIGGAVGGLGGLNGGFVTSIVLQLTNKNEKSSKGDKSESISK